MCVTIHVVRVGSLCFPPFSSRLFHCIRFFFTKGYREYLRGAVGLDADVRWNDCVERGLFCVCFVSFRCRWSSQLSEIFILTLLIVGLEGMDDSFDFSHNSFDNILSSSPDPSFLSDEHPNFFENNNNDTFGSLDWPEVSQNAAHLPSPMPFPRPTDGATVIQWFHYYRCQYVKYALCCLVIVVDYCSLCLTFHLSRHPDLFPAVVRAAREIELMDSGAQQREPGASRIALVGLVMRAVLGEADFDFLACDRDGKAAVASMFLCGQTQKQTKMVVFDLRAPAQGSGDLRCLKAGAFETFLMGRRSAKDRMPESYVKISFTTDILGGSRGRMEVKESHGESGLNRRVLFVS
jgi:hypothetical protein